MPTYDLYCKHCNSPFPDEKLTFSEFDNLLNRKCGYCDQDGGLTVQVNDVSYTSVKDVKTIGQQAEKNSKKKGKYFASEQEAKQKEQAVPDSWYGSLSPEKHKQIIKNPNKKLAKQAAKDYVLTGK